MSLELQLIRASDFVRVTAEGDLDLQKSKLALGEIARACRKRGIPRAMLDLRKFQPGPQPVLAASDLTELVNTFFESGFAKEQRLAVVYTSDPHRRARLFSFLCSMHGWQVKGFSNYENAMLWLSDVQSDLIPDRRERTIPIQTGMHSRKVKRK